MMAEAREMTKEQALLWAKKAMPWFNYTILRRSEPLGWYFMGAEGRSPDILHAYGITIVGCGEAKRNETAQRIPADSRDVGKIVQSSTGNLYKLVYLRTNIGERGEHYYVAIDANEAVVTLRECYKYIKEKGEKQCIK